MRILPPRIELLVTFYELTTNGIIIIFTSINSKLKTTCQAEVLFSINIIKQRKRAVPCLTLVLMGDGR